MGLGNFRYLLLLKYLQVFDPDSRVAASSVTASPVIAYPRCRRLDRWSCSVTKAFPS